jgi:chloramphenicol-sensitive protein RarD
VHAREEHPLEGLAYAIGAYGFWGLVPIFWKALGRVPAHEVLAHRVAWSLVFVALAITFTRAWRRVGAVLSSPRAVLTMAVSATLVTANWGIFIWAVQSGRLVQASIGYYVNPLLSVMLGVVVLGERLRRAQVLAVVLALAGVVYFAVASGVWPWVSLALAGTFGLYGLVRKRAPVEPLVGLFVETSLVAPLAIGFVAWLASRGIGAFGTSTRASVMLIAAGPITAVPLVWFAAAARRLPLSTLGFAQYLAPTLQLALAVIAYGEPLGRAHVVTFACIWSALALYSLDGWRSARALRLEAR